MEAIKTTTTRPSLFLSQWKKYCDVYDQNKQSRMDIKSRVPRSFFSDDDDDNNESEMSSMNNQLHVKHPLEPYFDRVDLFFFLIRWMEPRIYPNQMKMIRMILGACLSLIFGDENMILYKKEIYRKYRFSEQKDGSRFVLIWTPRQVGKTTAVSLFVAAYMLCFPRSSTTVFSVSKKLSANILSSIKGYFEIGLQKSPLIHKLRKIRDTQENFDVKVQNAFGLDEKDDIRKVEARIPNEVSQNPDSHSYAGERENHHHHHHSE